MIKYSFEQKKALVTAYLNGEGGIRTVIKKYGYSNRSQLQRWIVGKRSIVGIPASNSRS